MPLPLISGRREASRGVIASYILPRAIYTMPPSQTGGRHGTMPQVTTSTLLSRGPHNLRPGCLGSG